MPREPICAAPRIDFDALQRPSLRHRCEVLHDACLFNGSVYPLAGPNADHARAVAQAMVVRSQFGSHQTFPLAHLHPMVPAESAGAALLARAVRDRGLSPCVPLVWVPTWAFSFADSFVSSLVPIDELQSAGLIDENVLLRPDLWAWPRSKNPLYRMLGHLSAAPIRSVREEAPRCDAAAAAAAAAGGPPRQCAAHCYSRVLVCNFRSTFDAFAPPMAPWRAAQRVAASVAAGRPVDAAAAISAAEAPDGDGPLRVIFVNRTRTKFSRSLTNLDVLLQRCASARRSGGIGGRRVVCRAHEFGAGSLRADVRAARAADVLVGTHGAGLTNAFFMRRGAALVEVRPYNFEGAWPDGYFRSLTALEQAIFYFQVSSGSPKLSSPVPKPDVSVWDARDHGVELPWRTLRDVLAAVAAVNRSRERYLHRVWTRGAVFVAQPDCKPRPACLKRRRLQEADALPSYTRRYDYRGADYLRVPADTLTFFRPVLPFKVGSTEWMRLLLLQQTGRRIATQPNGGGLLSAPKVAYYNASGVERRGGAVERLTFCLVRHPYSRLLSYYLDKLQLHKPKASVMPHTFGARQRSLHPDKPLNKSFAELVRAIEVHSGTSSRLALEHFAPISEAYPLCTAPGTRVLKVEEIDRWYATIVRALRLERFVASGWEGAPTPPAPPPPPPPPPRRTKCASYCGNKGYTFPHVCSVQSWAAKKCGGCAACRRSVAAAPRARGRQPCFYVPRGRDCATALDPPLAQAAAGTAAADADAHATHASDRVCKYLTPALITKLETYYAKDLANFGYAAPKC